MLVGCSRGRRGSGIPRRQMLVRMGEAGFGLSLPMLFQPATAQAATVAAGAGAEADSCVFVFLSGGPSQYETFDPKPDAPADIRGTFRPIRTNVPGIDVCEHLPLLARQADKYALLRSLTHTDGNHASGLHLLMTGRPYPRSSDRANALSREDFPHHGSVLAQVRPPSSPAVPGFVTVPEQISPTGSIRTGQHAGFLGGEYDPMVVHGEPATLRFTPGELKVAQGLTDGRLLRRRALLAQANLRTALDAQPQPTVPPQYMRAFDIILGGEAAAAFDLDRETGETRDRYGRHVFGQSLLMARRLVEAGVRLVAVNWIRHDDGPGGQGWDTHAKHLPWCKDELLPPTDRGLSALLTDLHDRGLLSRTLVVVLGEFGRTPRFNSDGGRDHWPQVSSVLMAGGGIRGGQVYGSSTPDGAYPASDPFSPADVAATLYHALGVDPRTEIHDPFNRPYPVSEGEPLRL
jgi:hypothetical protein